MKVWMVYLASLVLHYSGINRLAQYWAGPGLSILMFHRIQEKDDILPLSVRKASFDKIIEILSKNGRVVDLGEGLEAIDRGDRGTKYSITFDDGYADNISLKDLVPPAGAVVYLATGLIGSRLTWVYRLKNALLSTKTPSIDLEFLGLGINRIESAEEKDALLLLLNKKLKDLPSPELEKAVDHIVSECAIEMPVEDRMLNWQEVKDMSRDGVIFGGHTVNHAILSRLEPEAQKQEIDYCRNDILRELEIIPHHFAYPNGAASDFSEHTIELIKEAGFSDAVTTIEGVNYRGYNPWVLKRFNIYEKRLVNPMGNFSLARFYCETSGVIPRLREQKGMKNKSYSVLMYHGVHDHQDDPGNYDPVYSVTKNEFVKQLSWIKENGYKTILLSDAIKETPGEKQIVLSFDDGDISNYNIAFPLLLEYGMCAEFFVTTNRIDKPEGLTTDQIKEMSQRGMSIQGHGHTHRFLPDLSIEEIAQELQNSKVAIERIIGEQVTSMSLPGGRGDNRVIEIARNTGYKAICNSTVGHNNTKQDPLHIKRIVIPRGMRIQQFEKMIRGQGTYYYYQIARQRLLALAKRLLGNRIYVLLRSRIVDDNA